MGGDAGRDNKGTFILEAICAVIHHIPAGYKAVEQSERKFIWEISLSRIGFALHGI